jgi:hypothetical protein
MFVFPEILALRVAYTERTMKQAIHRGQALLGPRVHEFFFPSITISLKRFLPSLINAFVYKLIPALHAF